MNTTSVKQFDSKKKGSKVGTRFQKFGKAEGIDAESKLVDFAIHGIAVPKVESALILGRVITFNDVEPDFLSDDSEPMDPIRALVCASYEQDGDPDENPEVLPDLNDSLGAGLATIEAIRKEYDE